MYKDEGCQAKVERQSLAAHLKGECDYSDSGTLKSEVEKREETRTEKGKGRQVDEGGVDSKVCTSLFSVTII